MELVAGVSQLQLAQAGVAHAPRAIAPRAPAFAARPLQQIKHQQRHALQMTSAAAVDFEALEAESLATVTPTPAATTSRGSKASRRYREQAAKVPSKTTALAPLDAIKLVLSTASAKFSETIEVHARLNIDPKYTDQQLRATVSLPKGTGALFRPIKSL